MDGLIADFTVPGVPDPMPVVVKAIPRKGFEGRGPGPQVIVNSGRNSLRRGAADRWAPLVAKRPRHVDIADRAVTQMMNGFDHAGVGARLAAVLANAVVLFYGAHQLAAFKPVVRARFFNINVFPGLTGPDGHQRVPMIGRGDRDRVYLFVFKQLANIDVRFWLWQAHLFDLLNALLRHVFVDVAQGGKFCPGNARKAVDVIIAAPAHSADCYSDTIVCAEDTGVAGCGGGERGSGDAGTGDS